MGVPEREVDQFARSVMNECDRDLVAAKKLAREKFASDEDLRGKFEAWCLLLVDEALDGVWRSYRTARLSNNNASMTLSRPAALLIAGGKAFNQMLLMEYEMPDGRRLGDMTKAELYALAKMMIKAGQTQLSRGRWLLGVSELLQKDSDTPRAKLVEADLQRMRQRAGAAA